MRTLQTKTSIGTSNGDFFDYSKPEKHDFDINVIAQSLSKVCRYNGHNDGDAHYSVAEHCLLVSHIVPKEYALEGLLHDASEAYTGDIQKPLKEMLPCFKKIEDRIEKALALHFNLQYPYPLVIKEADGALYQAERDQIATSVIDALWHTDKKAADVTINCWPPRLAKRKFLERFYELKAIRDGQRNKTTAEAPELRSQKAA